MPREALVCVPLQKRLRVRQTKAAPRWSWEAGAWIGYMRRPAFERRSTILECTHLRSAAPSSAPTAVCAARPPAPAPPIIVSCPAAAIVPAYAPEGEARWRLPSMVRVTPALRPCMRCLPSMRRPCGGGEADGVTGRLVRAQRQHCAGDQRRLAVAREACACRSVGERGFVAAVPQAGEEPDARRTAASSWLDHASRLHACMLQMLLEQAPPESRGAGAHRRGRDQPIAERPNKVDVARARLRSGAHGVLAWACGRRARAPRGGQEGWCVGLAASARQTSGEVGRDCVPSSWQQVRICRLVAQSAGARDGARVSLLPCMSAARAGACTTAAAAVGDAAAGMGREGLRLTHL